MVSEDLRMCVVVPLANEETTIDEFLRRVLAQLGDKDRLLCVLDNICKDATKARVRHKSEEDPRVKLVWAPENRSVVDAYFRGYREALKYGSRWVLEMDGGLSHIPEQIPRFIEAMEGGVDFAAGSRFASGGRYSGRLTRFALSKGGSMLANLVLGTRMRDMTSGFECFSRRAMEHVVSRGVASRAHFFQTEIRYMLRGWKWVEVPITYQSPSEGVSGGTITEALKNLWKLRQQGKAEARLKQTISERDWHDFAPEADEAPKTASVSR
jgi:dolichol-phosphate mannosyltransferase